MKTILAAVVLLLGVSTQAFANDSSVPYIKVDKILNTKKGEVVIKGDEAFRLASILPLDSVYANTRSLTITSNNRNITISCNTEFKAGVTEEQKGNLGSVESLDQKKTSCIISAVENKALNLNDGETDFQNWEPQVCKQN